MDFPAYDISSRNFNNNKESIDAICLYSSRIKSSSMEGRLGANEPINGRTSNLKLVLAIALIWTAMAKTHWVSDCLRVCIIGEESTPCGRHQCASNEQGVIKPK
jgi:hypothetical protein